MRVFEVEQWYGNERGLWRGEAEDADDAVRRAEEHRYNWWRQQNSREDLEAKQESIDAELERVNQPGFNFAAGVSGGAVGMGDAIRGAADSLLNMGQGILSLVPGNSTDGAVAKLEELRNSNMESQIKLATRVHESIAGREATFGERARIIEDREKFMQRGKLAADVAVGVGGGVATLGAKSIKGMIGLGAAEGGLGAYLMSDTKGLDAEDGFHKRVGDARWGAVFGGGLALLPSVVVGAKNWLGRRIERAAGGREALNEARAELGRLGIHRADPLQLTGDPRIGIAVQDAAGQEAQGMFAQQMSQAVSGVSARTGIQLPTLDKLLDGSADAVGNVMDTFGSAVNRLRGARNKEFGAVLDGLDEVTQGARIIPAGKTVDAAREILASMGESFGRSVQPSSAVFDVMKDILEASAGGGFTAKRAGSILQRLTALQRTGRWLDETGAAVAGNETTARGFGRIQAKKLKDALLAAMDDVPAADNASGILKTARAKYAAQSDEIAQLEDAFSNTIGGGGTPEQILSKLKAADADAARTFVSKLRELQGGQEVIDDLNRYMFSEAVRAASQAKVTAGRRAGDFDLQVFADVLSSSGKQSRLRGLLNADQEAALTKSLNSLRLLFNNENFNRGVVKNFMNFDLQHLAINALSRDPGFMGRMIAGAVQRGEGAEWLFFTEAGQKVLYNAVNHTLKAPKTAAAVQSANATMAFLTSMWGAGEQMEQLRQEYRNAQQELGTQQ